MKTTQVIGLSIATLIAPCWPPSHTLGAGNAAGTDEITLMGHKTLPLLAFGALVRDVWTDGADVQVIRLDGEGPIVLAREGTVRSEPTLDGTGAIEGVLPAGQLVFDPRGRLSHRRCATTQCSARRLLPPRPINGEVFDNGRCAGARANTIMAKLWPAPEPQSLHPRITLKRPRKKLDTKMYLVTLGSSTSRKLHAF